MRKLKQNLAKRQILISPQYWTALSTSAFEKVLPCLRGRHTARVYLFLYQACWRKRRKNFRASFKTLAELTGLDYRTVEGCVRELELKRFIIRTSKGVLHSNKHLPVWRVPAAEFSMSRQGWVPVPNFIITDYMRADSSCTLLPLLLYYQNMQKLNDCWPSVWTLSAMLHWKERRVYDALKLTKDKNWKKLHPNLPTPLHVEWRHKKGAVIPIRHFQVRAVRYERDEKKTPFLTLDKEFSEIFVSKGKTARA
jgi:hypothetical protein